MQRPLHKSTPDPVAAPKNIPFGTIFIEFGDTKKCCTFSGLELAPKSRKKLIGPLSCINKRPKSIQSLWEHPKKIPFVQKHKQSALCAIFCEKTQFGAFPEAKKGNWRSQLHAQRSKMHSIPLGPSEKKFLFFNAQRKRDMCEPLGKENHFGAFPEAKKANWRFQLHALRSKMHSIPLGPSEKIPFVQKHKEGAICAILREKTPFWGIPRG